MKIYLASDHAGYDLKLVLHSALRDHGYVVEDLGPHGRDLADDYPDYVSLVAKAVSDDPQSRGIVMGGSGEGEAMVANRHKGIRAAVVYSVNPQIVRLSREHNDANILSLAARFLSDDEARAVALLWLETPFSGEARHSRRIAKIDSL